MPRKKVSIGSTTSADAARARLGRELDEESPRAGPASSKRRAPQILIVDDHELLRQGLRDLLTTGHGWQVCGEAAEESEGLKKFRTLKPDVVIVDISLRQGDGIDLVKRIMAIDPAARILMLSMHDEMLYAPRALRAGAMGYVSKQQPAKAIVQAVAQILDSKLAFSQRVTDQFLRLAAGGMPQIQPSPVDVLSDREIEVFELIGRGMPTDQIASHLRISPKTVHSYRERLKSKLNVKNANELTLLAVHWVVEHE